MRPLLLLLVGSAFLFLGCQNQRSQAVFSPSAQAPSLAVASSPPAHQDLVPTAPKSSISSVPTRLRSGQSHPTLAIGAAAPDFCLPGCDGAMHRLTDYASARLLVIIFTCNHCPVAQAYEQRINDLWTRYTTQGVAVVAINPDTDRALRLDELGYTDLGDSLPAMKLRLADHHLLYPYLYDGELQQTAQAYGPRVTPHAFLFDAQRHLRYEGRIDDSQRPGLVHHHDLEQAIETLLAGGNIAVPSTHAFGCSTKWLEKAAEVRTSLAALDAEPVTLSSATISLLHALRANRTLDPVAAAAAPPSPPSGMIRLVNFWSTTCGPCVNELPDLVTLNRMYRRRAFEMVTVSVDFPDERPEILRVLQQVHASGTNYLFATNDTYGLMAAFDPQWDASLPYSVLLDADGTVLTSIHGPIDPLALRRLIVASLARSH